MAIAQVFEQQGRYRNADSLYRQVLHQDPSREQARERIQQIAALTGSKTDRPPATTDSATPIQLARQTGRAEFQSASLPGESRSQSSTAGREPAVARATAESLATAARLSIFGTRLPEAVAKVPATRTARVAERLTVSPSVRPRPVAEADELADLAAVPEEVIVSGSGPVLPREGEAGRLVSLTADPQATVSAEESMEALMSSPAGHVDVLLEILRADEDHNRRALAATLLSEAAAEDTRVNTALEYSQQMDSAVVVAAASESLLARGAMTDRSAALLLSLLEHSDSDLRGRIVSSSRQLAGTSWEAAAAEALMMRLDDSAPTVRGMAALTLGEFTVTPDVILNRLVDRYTLETDPGVQSSLELAAVRIDRLTVKEGVPLPFEDEAAVE